MGLKVVYRIVESLGGKIDVYSIPGKGTTFNVYLPRIDKALVKKKITSLPVFKGKGHILLIDNQKEVIEVTKEILTQFGYEVVGKTDPVEALELFQLQPKGFDLVIIDQDMSKMSGVELAQRIRQINSQIPIILWSGLGYINSREIEEFLSFKNQRFIQKPFSSQELIMVIRELLEKEGDKDENLDD